MSPPQDPTLRGRPHLLVLAAAAVGVGTAAAVWLFKRMIEAATWASSGWLSDSWMGVGLPWIVLMPVAGGLVVGILLHLAGVPEEPGHGVAEVIGTVTPGGPDLPERETPVKATAAALSLGSGASLGPEDPAVEIGGSVGRYLSRRWRLPRDAMRTLVAGGGAAGLAAAFHAPLAAIVFAAEVFRLRLLSGATALVAVASVTAFLAISLVSPGVEPEVPRYAVRNGWEVLLCLGLGAIAGALAAGQIRLMYTVEYAFLGWRAVPRWVKPALGGLALGSAGVFLPELLGIGYGTLHAILLGEVVVLALLVAFVLGKAALMAISFGSGFLGGFFAPSLFIGAALGAAFGLAAEGALPGVELAPATFAAVGMAAFLAGTVRAPFTAVLLIPALSGSYALVPLLLVATQAAYWSSRALEEHSLYTYGIAHRDDHPSPAVR